MDFQTIKHEVREGILILTLHRPEQLNAFTVTMADELERTAPAARLALYEERLAGVRRRVHDAARRGASAERSARAIEHALFAARPRLRLPPATSSVPNRFISASCRAWYSRR